MFPPLRWFHLWAFFLPLVLLACGSENQTAPDINQSLPPPAFSKEIAQQCLAAGNLSCAREQFCALSGEGTGLRCCVSQFLENYFSENTRTLGKLLGYSPQSFAEIRQLSRQEIIDAKALPFAELFLLSSDAAPALKGLMVQWGLALIQGNASAEELAERFSAFGAGLEATSLCLGKIGEGFHSDEIEQEVFASEVSLTVNARDLKFLEALTGLLGYGIQAASAYQAGFENFPTLPVSPEFLADLNGHDGEGDARLGDLEDGDAAGVAGKFSLLQASFAALKAYSELSDRPGLIDVYLNWRFRAETQGEISGVLKAAYLSLTLAQWTPLPEGDWEINLSGLGQAEGLPDGQNLDRASDVLFRDEEGKIQINFPFVKQWASPVLREAAP